MKSINRRIYRLLSKFCSAELAATGAVSLLGYKRFFDWDEIYAIQREEQKEDVLLLSSQGFLKHVFKAFYGKICVDRLSPDRSVAHAQSFVPYYAGMTNIVLYNFFGRNYGIRDPILYRLILLNHESKPVHVKNFLLQADGVRLVSDYLGDFGHNGSPHGSVVIQAFHPRIKTPANQLRFSAFYYDRLKGVVSAIHSMQLPENEISTRWLPSLRSFGFSDTTTFTNTCYEAHRELVSANPNRGTNIELTPLQPTSELIGENGYLAFEKESSCPTTIWHDGPVPHFVRVALQPRVFGPCRTSFFVPQFEIHAPILMVSESQIGFRPSTIKILAHDEGGNALAEKDVAIKDAVVSVDLKELFCNLAGAVSFVVYFGRDLGEFESFPPCYLHIYYRSGGGWADQVHSDSTVGFSTDPFQAYKSYRCRKFAPLIFNPNLKFIYSVINAGGDERGVNQEIKIRINTDKGSECVIKIPISRGVVTNIFSEDILKKVNYDIEKAAIVQLEHEQTNFNGMWFGIDQKTKHLAVDHFTGG